MDGFSFFNRVFNVVEAQNDSKIHRQAKNDNKRGKNVSNISFQYLCFSIIMHNIDKRLKMTEIKEIGQGLNLGRERPYNSVAYYFENLSSDGRTDKKSSQNHLFIQCELQASIQLLVCNCQLCLKQRYYWNDMNLSCHR